MKLTHSLGPVDKSLADIAVSENGRGFDVIPILASERINAILLAQNNYKSYVFFLRPFLPLERRLKIVSFRFRLVVTCFFLQPCLVR